jgi:hypothetical protein
MWEVTVRRLCLAVLFVVVGWAPVQADQLAVAPDPRLAAARKLLEVTGGGRMAVQAAQMILNSIKKMHPDVPAAIWEQLEAEIKPEEFVELTVPIYAKYLTVEEMQQLQGFYESAIGKKLLQTLPLMMQDSMAAGQEWAKEVGARILKRLKECGYTGTAPAD